MRVSQRTDYALRALTLLAMRQAGAVVAAGELAGELSLPRRFVEQQLTDLARAGIVESVRGARGGYRLAHPADQITAEQIVAALQGDILDVPHVPRSAVTEMWARASVSLGEALERTSLSDLATRQADIESRVAEMYYI